MLGNFAPASVPEHLPGVVTGPEATQWLTRIRADMLALVNRRAVRWAALSETPIEQQLIGAPARG